jgi:hypothetical protein
MRNTITSAFLSLTLLAVLAGESRAQQSVSSYHPATPTLSPYLQLFRPNPGPLPNYQAFVQPLQNQQQTNLMQQTQITQLQQNQQDLQQQYATPAAATQTGVGGVYNSLSHFYPMPTTAGGSAQRGKQAAHH